jgi:hypothetical protein
MEISGKSDSGLLVGRRERHIAKEQLEVCVYTPDCVLSGHIYCLPKQRLLDLLNGLLAGGLHADTDFLPISEVTSHTLNGEETTTQFAAINKASILFISEIKRYTEPSTEASYDIPTVVGKFQVIARFYMPPYMLSGQMHCSKRQRLSDLLNTKDRFVPMTNVDIVPRVGVPQSAAFVAVNKAQIVYAQEVSS